MKNNQSAADSKYYCKQTLYFNLKTRNFSTNLCIARRA